MRVSRTLALLQVISSASALLNADELAVRYFGNDAPWYRNRIPFFESSDRAITEVYYYRWKIFRSHQRDLGANGYISTEFLDNVGWQNNPWASLNDATGFHLLEGRWCRDRRFKEDYATFMYSANSNTRQYTESMATSVWQGYLVDGVASDATSRLAAMQSVYNAWQDSFDSSQGLYWVEPLRDATEYTISSIDASNGVDGFFGGDAFRPSINSYQYANAKAIANIAALKGGMSNTADLFNWKASAIKLHVQDALWNSTFKHFIDRYKVNNAFVRYWAPIRGRELVGYVPWAHDLPDDTVNYAVAWRHILNGSELAGIRGLRTVEPSYQYYLRQYRYEGNRPECQWNGPVWPYQTTQVLTGLANFLDHYPRGTATGLISSKDYTRLLREYAQLHYNQRYGGKLDLEEDYHPNTGAPIVGLRRSHHYFHSGFIDLVLSGFVGIRASAHNILEVNPLIDGSTISYFRADRIIYHGNEIAVQWDSNGSRYGSVGLHVEVNGRIVARSRNLTKLRIQLPRLSPPTFPRKIAKSIQLSSQTNYPRGSVSVVGTDASSIHGSIDGRIWFFPETDVANGWSTPAGDGSELWFQIDFGTQTTISSAELAFFADFRQGFDAPQSYRVQTLNAGSWVDVAQPSYGRPVANGITDVSWKAVQSNQVRLLFKPKQGVKVRLVEFKVF
ncbi:Six-hairpin glycosidase-like protein [Pyrenochaeta sp. MPI-SDFR-AT-0127]|nr:Six-hairpin glycosidase-like protein [Pyrenochaeta sp. MPI-SDFR-AT-0127]